MPQKQETMHAASRRGSVHTASRRASRRGTQQGHAGHDAGASRTREGCAAMGIRGTLQEHAASGRVSGKGSVHARLL